MTLCLTILANEHPVMSLPLWRRLHTLGRARGADLSLPVAALAPLHYYFLKRPDGRYVALAQTPPRPAAAAPASGRARRASDRAQPPPTLAPGLRLPLAADLELLVEELSPEALPTTAPLPEPLGARWGCASLTAPGGHEWRVGQAASLGSADDNDLRLDDPHVSAHHAQLALTGGRYFLRDLGSTNGTWVDGRQVHDAELPERCELRLGGSRLLFRALPARRAGESVLDADRAAPGALADFEGLIGVSAPMRALYDDIRRLASQAATITILGENGTGKELVARALHALGRPGKPLRPLNCAALPSELVASELFGHVRGAFTGAVGARAGAFEAASDGTLFLDEIGELPLAVQPALLRAVEYGEIAPVGADNVRRVQTRLVAATNRDLGAEVAAGRFRADLYHRLLVLPLRVPPLRERGDDVLLLARHFLRLHGPAQRPPCALAPDAEAALRAYPWPGNVRELANVIQRALFLSDAARRSSPTLGAADLRFEGLAQAGQERRALAPRRAETPPTPDGLPHQGRASGTFAEQQRAAVVDALRDCGGNKQHAAARLGIARSSLYRFLDSFGIAPEEYGA